MTSRIHEGEDFEPWMAGQQAGALRAAVRGRRGQAFLRELIDALDALPSQELAAGALEDPETGCCCAFGAVARARAWGQEEIGFDPMDGDIWRPECRLAEAFDVAETLAWQVIAENEALDSSNDRTWRRRRWRHVRNWAASEIESTKPSDEPQP